MTDEPTAPAPTDSDPSSSRARIEASPAPRWDALPFLYLIGFLVLAGTLVYLYRHPPEPKLAQQAAGRVDTLQQQVQGLRDQVAQLQSQPAATASAPAPAPAAAELAPLQQRVEALEQRPAAGAGAAPVGLVELGRRVQALEDRGGPDLAPLTARLDALEKRPVPDLGPLDAKLDGLANRLGSLETAAKQNQSKLDALAAQQHDTEAKTGQRLDGLDSRIGGVEALAKQTQSKLEATAERADRAARLQGASAALAAGQRLGEIPGAPPALARFAHDNPPTEAGLRLSFDRYAEAAQHASQPAIMDNQDFGTRLWNRAQQVVTVRQGDRVLLGDPITGVLSHAREALDAGDLQGAVKSLGQLAGPAAQAMQPWTDQAQALLAARSAIASMAAG